MGGVTVKLKLVSVRVYAWDFIHAREYKQLNSVIRPVIPRKHRRTKHDK